MMSHCRILFHFLFVCSTVFAEQQQQPELTVYSVPSPLVEPNSRVDCAPKPGENKEQCLARNCQWDDHFDQYHSSVPLCYFPPNTGYGIQSRLSGTNKLLLRRLQTGGRNPYGQDLAQLEFSPKQLGSALHIRIGAEGRYVPPVPLNFNAEIGFPEEKLVAEIFPRENATSSNELFYFTVVREGEPHGARIWDTSIGGLLFADQYIQIATFLPSDRIYGFGENAHQQLKHDFSKYATWGMYGRDQPPDSYTPNSGNLYGVHQFYLGLEPSGKAHGVFIFNSNVQEITTGPGPHFVYRTIGGQLDVFFLPGPTPEMVVQQYEQLVGRPSMPAYWALGYQFCRYGYKSLDDLKQTIGRIRNEAIPLDVVYADIDYMDRYKDFTVDKQKWSDLGDYVRELHQQGLKFVPIIDPAIEVDYDVFERALQLNVSFVEWPREDQVPQSVQQLYPMAKQTKIMLGVVWPDKHVAFPDFLDPTNNTQRWWSEEFERFYDEVPFDGIWIDMNEPSNFVTNQQSPIKNLETLKCPLQGADSHLDAPAYQTIDVYQWGQTSSLSEKTLCMLGEMGRGKYQLYDTHNLYGWAETVVTRRALESTTGKRGQLLSRSTFASSGFYGSHWTGDNSARWPDLRASIIGVMEFNIFGIPHVGADVCGFNMPSNEELCLRWQQLGAYHPFYRNHNSDDQPPQDPAQWKSVAVATRAANLFRYQHLPFLYSLHFRTHINGGTVIRPLFFEFPADVNTHQLNYQFLWGDSMMVVPVLDPGVDSVRGYFPHGAIWYSISESHAYGNRVSGGGNYRTLQAPWNTTLPTFLKGGAIIPKQKPALTVAQTRQNEFQLMIALDSDTLSARGELFWDDGESIIDDLHTYPYYHFDFAMEVSEKKSQLVINCTHSPPATAKSIALPALATIEVLGHPHPPQLLNTQLTPSLTLNSKPLNIGTDQFEYNAVKQYVKIDVPGGLVDFHKKVSEDSKGNDDKQHGGGHRVWIIQWQNRQAEQQCCS